MSETQGAGAVIFANDVARIVLFYERVLSMQQSHHDAGHTVLDSACTQLVIHAIPAHIAAQYPIACHQPSETTRRSSSSLLFRQSQWPETSRLRVAVRFAQPRTNGAPVDFARVTAWIPRAM
jgi:hypothetical protein